MNLHLRNALVISGALVLGFLVEAASGQEPAVVYYYAAQPQPVYYAAAEVQQPYLRLHANTGGTVVTARYGCGQEITIVQAGKPYSLETNQPCAGFAYALEVDRRAAVESANATALARYIAVPIVAGNPCPQQQCAPSVPIRGYCGRIVGYSGGSNCQQPCQPQQQCATGYCGATSQPTCAPPCGTTPYWCGRTSRWCTTSGSYWCGQTRRWCGTSVAPAGGSCCNGGGGHDGRNQMVAYAPGDPRGVCHCAQNANGPGTSCACPSDCTQCNPNSFAGYAGYSR